MENTEAFLINLNRSHDRLDRMSQRLEAAEIPFTRVAATDGKAWLEAGSSSKSAIYSDNNALKKMGRTLMVGEVGCYLSHLDAAKRFLDTDADWGLVLEDDTQIPKNTGHVLSEILMQIPDGIDCVNLGRRAKHTTRILDAATGLTRAYYFPVTTTALLWSRQGASAFLEQGSSIAYPVDVFLQKWLSARGTGAALTTPLFAPDESESEISGQKRRQGHTRFYQGKRLLRLLSNRINAKRRAALDG